MARSRVLQAAIKGKLEQDFAEFQRRFKMNDADAVRDLLTLALRIKLNDSDDGRPSNRELMEEIYRTVRTVSAVSDVTHGQTFDGEKLFRVKDDAKAFRQQIKADVNNKVDAFLEGEKKRIVR
ncbi:hypothetical protein IB292_21370 [Vibrio parahaemolyticus]|uniref:Uncharacterized protein n=1 Tax=Vibrio parahaemolyticus TaxID=670 RepID=A0A9Q3UGN3_VIBPH|nr:hypothetical protein [Vibrio parahaemolyticus]MCC3807572.1 hypothetical protein [Vibrio parahaemolyticus]